jgi:hypothetical protein
MSMSARSQIEKNIIAHNFVKQSPDGVHYQCQYAIDSPWPINMKCAVFDIKPASEPEPKLHATVE